MKRLEARGWIKALCQAGGRTVVGPIHEHDHFVALGQRPGAVTKQRLDSSAGRPIAPGYAEDSHAIQLTTVGRPTVPARAGGRHPVGTVAMLLIPAKWPRLDGPAHRTAEAG